MFKLIQTLCVIFASNIFLYGCCQRIVGGNPAKEGDFPYQVSIRHSYNDEHRCGGTIITPKYILSGAHCFYYSWGGKYPPIIISVVAGQTNLSLTENSIYRNASKIITHEKFDPISFANDIAIVELESDLPEDSVLIHAIPLNDKPINFGRCVVSGWGVQKFVSKNISEILLWADVYIVDLETCSQLYAKIEIDLFDKMLCAAHPKGETDACRGDSGGPLVCNGVLTGVISTGKGCGDAEFPGLYTDVSKYLRWIVDTITFNNSLNTTTEVSVNNTETATLSSIINFTNISKPDSDATTLSITTSSLTTLNESTTMSRLFSTTLQTYNDTSSNTDNSTPSFDYLTGGQIIYSRPSEILLIPCLIIFNLLLL